MTEADEQHAHLDAQFWHDRRDHRDHQRAEQGRDGDAQEQSRRDDSTWRSLYRPIAAMPKLITVRKSSSRGRRLFDRLESGPTGSCSSCWRVRQQPCGSEDGDFHDCEERHRQAPGATKLFVRHTLPAFVDAVLLYVLCW